MKVKQGVILGLLMAAAAVAQAQVWDADGDGKVTTNGDGVLDKDEFPAMAK